MRFMFPAGFIFMFEYVMKNYMDRTLAPGIQHTLAKGRIILKKHYNKGSAGNFLSSRPGCIRRIHAAALAAVSAGLLWMLPKKHAALAKTGLSFLAGGGLSNLHDRLRHGHVIDYVSFGFGPQRFRRLVFNLADLFIFAGIFVCTAQVFVKEEQ